MPVSKFKPKKWVISALDIAKANAILKKGKPPVTKDEAIAFYIDVWDALAEIMPKLEYAAKKLPKLQEQVTYWKNKALKAQPRITPIKYDQ